MNFVHVMQIDFLRICIIFSLCAAVLCVRKYSSARKEKLREEVRLMFQHAYDGYLNHASDFDELRPLTCDGINTWGSYSLTLIDALDTLAVMGNYTEFRRVANLIIDKVKFDKDINVSVFETNIRIVGGLLSAHLLARKAGMELEPGWPCNGPLLRLAEDVAKRLIPAFDSKTGMPYGTVNLMYGVPRGETSVTCTAGVGTFIVEFGTLSRLTGDPIFEEVALNAIYSLWKHRSPISLLGNHIDVQTGQWTAQDAGIGAGIDSFFEYLVKGAILLNRPDLLEIFHEGRTKIDEYMKRDDWYLWVGMNKGQVTLPVFQSLEAYWPGVLSLIGDINSAMKIIHNYHTVWRQYGFLPEFYNIPGAEAASNRESYPLRPELVESAMYLYRATKDPYLLEIGEDMLRSIQHSARTSCGYATIKNVRDHRRDNRMESFFLSETTKYLYLLFDDDNFLHNNGRDGQIIETPNGICIIESGGYIFNTEAHPVDPSALNCCYGSTHDDIFDDFNLDDYSDEMFLIKESQQRENDTDKMDKYACPGSNIPEIEKINNLSVDIELTDATNTKTNLAKDLVDRFQAIKKEQQQTTQVKRFSTNDLIKIVNGANTVDDIPIVLSNFMKTQSVEPDVATKVFQVYSYTPFAVEYSSSVSIWNMFLQNHRIISNFEILERLSHDKYLNGTDMTVIINDILDILNSTSKESSKNTMNRTNHVHELMLTVQKEYYMRITNGTEMFIFSKSCALDSGKKLDDNVTLELFLLEEKLYNIPVPDPYVTNAIDANIFNKLHTLLHLRKRILDLVHRTENLSENVPTSNSARNDSPETVTTTDDTYLFKAEKSSNSPEKPINKDPVEAVGNLAVSKTDETTNTSILTDIMHSIMDSAMPVKSKFNDQKLLQRIRAQGVYMNQIQKYELLVCKAPTFIQRFAYRYDVV